jgi:hypothetical protein
MCSQDHVMKGRVEKRIKQGWTQTNDPAKDPRCHPLLSGLNLCCSWIYVPRPSSDFGAVRLLVDHRNDPMGKVLADALKSIGGWGEGGVCE